MRRVHESLVEERCELTGSSCILPAKYLYYTRYSKPDRPASNRKEGGRKGSVLV